MGRYGVEARSIAKRLLTASDNARVVYVGFVGAVKWIGAVGSVASDDGACCVTVRR